MAKLHEEPPGSDHVIKVQFTSMVISQIMSLSITKYLAKASKPKWNISHQFWNLKPKSNANFYKKASKFHFLKVD